MSRNQAKIIIGNDHTSIQLKQEIIKHLAEKYKIDATDCGAQGDQASDYPDYAQAVCKKLLSDGYDMGFLICGTGAGMCITANKINGIRAVMCSEPYSAKLARNHNDANILCIGARVVGSELAKLIIDSFIEAKFEAGRHARRVAKIMAIEKE